MINQDYITGRSENLKNHIRNVDRDFSVSVKRLHLKVVHNCGLLNIPDAFIKRPAA